MIRARRPKQCVIAAFTVEVVHLTERDGWLVAAVLAFIEQVVSFPTPQRVVASATIQLVVVVVTIEGIVALVGENGVVTIAAMNFVITPRCDNHIIAAIPPDHGICRDCTLKGNGFCAIRTVDDNRRDAGETRRVREHHVAVNIRAANFIPGAPAPLPGPAG